MILYYYKEAKSDMKKKNPKGFEVIESGLDSIIGGRCVCSPGGWAYGRDQGGCACACASGIQYAEANFTANMDKAAIPLP
jgi:hypothetical protein